MQTEPRPIRPDAEPPTGTSSSKRLRRGLKPLAATTFLLRNAGKTIPLTLVIMLAVMLIAGIVALMNCIPFSIRTIYGYSKEALAVTPRGLTQEVPMIVKKIKAQSPVPIERLMICRTAGSQVKSIVGKWAFTVLGMEQNDMRFYFKRQGVTKIVGRYPKPGEAAAIISAPVALNRRLKLGDELLGPTNEDSYSPNSVKVVGIAQTDRWLMATDIEYLREFHFPPVDIVVVFAHNLVDQDKMDHWAVGAFKGTRTQIFAYHLLERDTRDMFNILYKVLNIVIGTLVLVITFMMGMLINIYQSQRLVEFGLLQAIGYTKKQLIRRVLRETAAVLFFGWVLGVICAFGLLNAVKIVLMDPQGFALNTLDANAYQYTIPVPLAILVVAVLTVFLRFRKFDPVGVVERRLV